MNKTIENAVMTGEASVSRLAYQLWENAGRPSGRDLEFWLAAEAKARVAAQHPVTPAIPATAQVAPTQARTNKAPRSASNGTKKTWPKPYPNLPKF